MGFQITKTQITSLGKDVVMAISTNSKGHQGKANRRSNALWHNGFYQLPDESGTNIGAQL